MLPGCADSGAKSVYRCAVLSSTVVGSVLPSSEVHPELESATSMHVCCLNQAIQSLSQTDLLAHTFAGPLKCTWYPGMTDAEKAKSDPHKHIRRAGFAARGSISTSVLDCVGETPCVRLNRIPIEEGVEADVVAKCEFFNAGKRRFSCMGGPSHDWRVG